jgi:hypothetical protein
MNAKLVDSIIEMIHTLSAEEQTLLIQKLNLLLTQTPSETMTSESQDPWDIFLSIGNEAEPGKLENPSIEHDCYLYSQPH